MRTRLGLNLGYRVRDREGSPAGRFIGIEEADLVLLADAGTAWLAGDGPGQVPVNRIPKFGEWEWISGWGSTRGDRSVPRQRLSAGGAVKFIVRLQRRF